MKNQIKEVHVIKINSNNHTFKMSQHNESITICESGDIVTFETLDCFCNCLLPESAIFGVDNPKYSNPATGPLHIKGAKYGETLAVDILDIKLGEVGIHVSGPVNKIFDDRVKDFKINRMRVENDIVRLTSKLTISSKPMVGIIGVAAKEDISTSLPGVHGGNLDCSDISKGATVYLPILVDGGLLVMGDLHALMGDGEVGECGLEIEGEVTVKVTLIKGKSISSPRVETDDYLGIIGLGNTLEDACEHASKEMLKYLIEDLNIDKHEASKIISLCGDLKICQIVNDIKTVEMRLPKRIIEIIRGSSV